MKTRILIGAGLLISTAGIGIALAAADFDLSNGHRQERHDSRAIADAQGHPIRMTEGSQSRDHGGEHHRRSHHDDEGDDDDDGKGARPGPIPQNGPSDPKASVPDNGLFSGKTRPKVEVQ
ncbi:hypothetical protein [Azorhizobium doebereinerae]|uniref:hypothetical protein n=1 Tax=Azorhizobium doebereinerae TaxID=281091 RepID=UPI00040C9D79|nr:hypothetical protein [Azorhizobium doebereinerae]